MTDRYPFRQSGKGLFFLVDVRPFRWNMCPCVCDELTRCTPRNRNLEIRKRNVYMIKEKVYRIEDKKTKIDWLVEV
jgi:hypothetical protein